MNLRRNARQSILCLSLIIAMGVPLGPWRCWALAQDVSSEYRIKAAYLYNFLMYVTWPLRGSTQDGADMVIGILGENPFGAAFDEVKNKKITGTEKKLIIKEFSGSASEEQLRECHILFVAISERDRYETITRKLSSYPVLVVGDADNFVEAGGMISLLVIGNKVRWEINAKSIDVSGLRLSSQIFSNAIHVIE